MMPEPTVLPEWASQDVLNQVSGQYNVVEPPSEKKLEGWTFLEKPNRQWWNWFQRQTYLWLAYFKQQNDMNVVTDSTGVGLFPFDNAMIHIDAVDLDDPTLFFNGTGVKLPGAVPTFAPGATNGTLTLGVWTTSGNQPILGGGPNVVVNGRSSVIPT